MDMKLKYFDKGKMINDLLSSSKSTKKKKMSRALAFLILFVIASFLATCKQ